MRFFCSYLNLVSIPAINSKRWARNRPIFQFVCDHQEAHITHFAGYTREDLRYKASRSDHAEVACMVPSQLQKIVGGVLRLPFFMHFLLP